MMKKILVLYLLAIGNVFGQSRDLEYFDMPNFEIIEGKVIYRDVLEFEANQSLLHSTALRYASEFYKSAKSVIDVNDSENGLLIIKGTFEFMFDGFYSPFGTFTSISLPYTVNHVLTIESKNNRIRYTIDKFTIKSNLVSELIAVNPTEPIEDYIFAYNEFEKIKKPKKRDTAVQYNRSILLNEIDLITKSFELEIEPFFKKLLKDDW
jgi:hypothetical protein